MAFGAPKSVKKQAEAERARADQTLEGHLLRPDDAPEDEDKRR